MDFNLAELMQFEPQSIPPEKYSLREVELLIEKYEKIKDCGDRQFELVKELKATVEIWKKKKIIELAKPPKDKVTFQDLSQKFFQLYFWQESAVKLGQNNFGETDARALRNAAETAAELIVLLTGYLERLGVDAEERRKLFNEMRSD